MRLGVDWKEGTPLVPCWPPGGSAPGACLCCQPDDTRPCTTSSSTSGCMPARLDTITRRCRTLSWATRPGSEWGSSPSPSATLWASPIPSRLASCPVWLHIVCVVSFSVHLAMSLSVWTQSLCSAPRSFNPARLIACFLQPARARRISAQRWSI